MSTPVIPVVAATAPQSAKPLTAIQLIEQEIGNFFKQREQAIANVHAVDGAIQAAQVLLAKLKAELVKAENFAKAEAEKAEVEAQKLVGEAETEAKAVETKVIEFVKKAESDI